MSTRRILVVFGGLSVLPLLFLAGRLHADVNPSGSTPPVAATSTTPTAPTGRLSGEPVPALAGPAAGAPSDEPVAGAVSGAPTGGPISDQSHSGESVAGSPPEPSPLAPISAPAVQAEPGAQPSAPSSLTGSAVQLAVSGAALAPSPVMPATPPPDVVDDSQSIAGSVFDRDDDFNRHPVNSTRAITGSTFDREDRVDEHPVP
jgi:hypothetical protein